MLYLRIRILTISLEDIHFSLFLSLCCFFYYTQHSPKRCNVSIRPTVIYSIISSRFLPSPLFRSLSLLSFFLFFNFSPFLFSFFSYLFLSFIHEYRYWLANYSVAMAAVGRFLIDDGRNEVSCRAL